MPKLFPFTDAKAAIDYVIQVSLIIFSILAATYVGKCNEKEKDSELLTAYLHSINNEVAFEISKHTDNIVDAKQDLRVIQRAIDLSQYPATDSIYNMAANFLNANLRGVFRTFPPSTWDAMLAAGDSELIKDLDLKQQIAGSFAFRNTTVREDLKDWDAENKRVFDELSVFIDPTVLGDVENHHLNLERILLDPEGFRIHVRPLLLSMLRQCFNRLFHLEVSQGQFEILQEMLAEEVPAEPLSD